MAQIDVEHSSTERTQRIYARLAGFLFLWLIITGLGSMFMISHIVGSGAFAETARRAVASEHLFRLALCIGFIEPLSAVLLAFALYVTLRPVDNLLAQFAMYWRLGEAFLGGVGTIFGFLTLHLYNRPQPIRTLRTEQLQALLDLTNHAGSVLTNISATFFSIGSLIFFYVFLKSRYIPKALSVFGVFASMIVTLMLFGNLIFPEHAATLQYGWAPMAIAEVTTGFWLMFAVRIPAHNNPPTAKRAALRG